jgi:hypothetical protein
LAVGSTEASPPLVVILRPPACGDVLGVAELGRGNSLSAEIGGSFEPAVWLHNERDAAARCAGEDANVGAFGANVSVENGIRADIGGVDGAGEDRFDRAWSGVEGIPLDARSGARLKPSLRCLGLRFVIADEALGVGDVREKANAQHGKIGGGILAAAAGESGGRSGGKQKGGESASVGSHDLVGFV